MPNFKIVLVAPSISDPELLPVWLNLDILAVKRPAGQRIIQLLLDESKFTLVCPLSFHILWYMVCAASQTILFIVCYRWERWPHKSGGVVTMFTP